MTILPIALCAVAAAAAINLWLSIRIGAVRRATKIFTGDGNNPALIRRMRAQINFVENTPVVLAMIIAIELARTGNPFLVGATALYMLGRVAHALGMDDGPLTSLRGLGALITMLTQLALGIWAVSIAHGM